MDTVFTRNKNDPITSRKNDCIWYRTVFIYQWLHAVSYNDIDDVSNNYNLLYIDTSDRNMNHAVKRDEYDDDEFDH